MREAVAIAAAAAKATRRTENLVACLIAAEPAECGNAVRRRLAMRSGDSAVRGLACKAALPRRRTAILSGMAVRRAVPVAALTGRSRRPH
ncbi:hypothetical protein [Xanthomonas bonasiae]|uniref:hypothetical protein n=1 Tax=Xanthomonas bonasiae TaxID=2810351 RepID=UPI00178485A6|nr:hypothetical protein [Xanthomonas surreyensis]MBD7923590.1 hypothetical protein [Xanthomonas surreyensis]